MSKPVKKSPCCTALFMHPELRAMGSAPGTGNSKRICNGVQRD